MAYVIRLIFNCLTILKMQLLFFLIHIKFLQRENEYVMFHESFTRDSYSLFLNS